MSSRKCSVIGCSSVKRNPKISFFTVPKHNSLAWNSVINTVNCKETIVRFVCAEHFLPEDIVTTYSGHAQDIAQEIGNRLKCGLKKGAVPSVFNCVNDRVISGKKKPIYFISDHNYAKYYNMEPRRQTNLLKKEINCNILDEPVNIMSFNDLIKNFKNVVLPSGWMTHSTDDEIAFYKPNFKDGKMQIERQLVFKSSLEIQLYIYQHPVQIENINITLEYPICTKDISQAIEIIHYKRICPGGPNSIDFPGVRVKTAILENNKSWRHRKCKIMIDLKKRCKTCDHLIAYFRNCKHRALVKQSSFNGNSPTSCRTLKTNLKDKNNFKKSI